MIELLFVACLTAEPTQCRERSLLFTDVSPAQCMVGAQPVLANWTATHPNLDIKSWRCRTVTFTERDA